MAGDTKTEPEVTPATALTEDEIVKLQRLRERGQRDALTFLHDRQPGGGGRHDGAWRTGARDVFATKFAGGLRQAQDPITAAAELKLPWRTRLQLLLRGRVRVACVVELVSIGVPQLSRVWWSLQSDGKELKASIVEPEAPKALAEPAAPAAAAPATEAAAPGVGAAQ